MQALILFTSALTVASAGLISLVPVSYVASPLPLYSQAQDTRTGEYAYSYAGGPSAKEEVKTLDGVTRGAYSYVDAHGIVQSAQYIADDNGFRVAATNIPTEAQIGLNVPLETPEVQAAKAAHFAEHAKAIAALGRRKRSLTYASIPTAVSSQYHNQEHESVRIEAPVIQQYAAFPSVYASYEHVPVAVSSVPTSVSHQSRLQVHQGAKVEVSSPVYTQATYPVAVEAVRTAPELAVVAEDTVQVNAEPLEAVYAAPVAVSSVPTAVSSQSRHQVHNSQKIEVHNPVQAFHADSVAVEAVREAPVVVAPVAAIPTAVSSQSRTQIHNSAKVEVETPVYAAPVFASEGIVDSYGHPAAFEVAVDSLRSAPVEVNAYHEVPVVAAVPTAVSSQSRSQVHSGEKLEISRPLYASVHQEGLLQVPLDTPEVAAAKQAHAEAYAAEVAKHQGW